MTLKQKFFTAIFSAIPLFVLYMPKATPLFCIALVAVLLLPPREPLAPPNPFNIGLSIAALIFLFLSGTWGANQAYIYSIFPGFLGLLTLFGFMFALHAAQPKEVIPNVALYGFKISLILSLFVVVSDFLLDGVIWDFLKSTRFESTSYNKPLMIGCIISSAFISHFRYPTESTLNIKGWLVALWFGILLIFAFQSESDATKLALSIAIIALLLENRIFRFYGLLRYGFCIYALFLPTFFNYALSGTNFHWFETVFDHSTLHRLYSWQHFNKFIFAKPLLGWGAGASFLKPLKSTVILHPGTPNILTLETSTYAHNFVQQIWLESGFMGIVLLIALAIRTLNAIQKSPLFIRKNLLFLWVFTIVLMSFGVSIWHHWYWCSVLIGVTLSKLTSAEEPTNTKQ